MLEQTKEVLIPGGKLLIVTFHSLEDKIVKDFLNQNTAKKVHKSKYHAGSEEEDYYFFDRAEQKLIFPDEQEVRANQRSRSAKLRVARASLNTKKESLYDE